MRRSSSGQICTMVYEEELVLNVAIGFTVCMTLPEVILGYLLRCNQEGVLFIPQSSALWDRNLIAFCRFFFSSPEANLVAFEAPWSGSYLLRQVARLDAS